MESILFICKVCGKGHEALPPLENGVYRLPDTITTVRKDGAFIFTCVEHEQKEKGKDLKST